MNGYQPRYHTSSKEMGGVGTPLEREKLEEIVDDFVQNDMPASDIKGRFMIVVFVRKRDDLSRKNPVVGQFGDWDGVDVEPYEKEADATIDMMMRTQWSTSTVRDEAPWSILTGDPVDAAGVRQKMLNIVVVGGNAHDNEDAARTLLERINTATRIVN